MLLIKSQEDLADFIPNFLPAAPGERTLFDKIYTELQAMESEVGQEVGDFTNFPSDVIYSLRVWVANRALERALPKLDIVFTPNGLAVTNTQTLGAASQPRTAALQQSLHQSADLAIQRAFCYLISLREWVNTEAARKWKHRLFLPGDLSLLVKGMVDLDWEKSKHTEVQTLLQELSSHYLGSELVDKICAAKFGCSDAVIRLTSHVENWVIEGVKIKATTGNVSMRIHGERLLPLVNYIRNNPELYPEWTNSEVANLYKDYSFKNDRKSSGYWF